MNSSPASLACLTLTRTLNTDMLFHHELSMTYGPVFEEGRMIVNKAHLARCLHEASLQESHSPATDVDTFAGYLRVINTKNTCQYMHE